jgi:hypothetical protein
VYLASRPGGFVSVVCRNGLWQEVVKKYADGAVEKGQLQKPRAPAKPSNRQQERGFYQESLHLMEINPMKI